MNPEQKAPLPSIYFLRELTGVFIAGWTIYFLTSAIFDPTLAFVTTRTFQIINIIGLAAAIFHTITWFWVTVQVTPFHLKKSLQYSLFCVLIAAWFGASYFLLNFFYGK